MCQARMGLHCRCRDSGECRAALAAEAHPEQTLYILQRGLHNLDARIKILDPFDRQLENAIALPLSLEQQLGVKEPGLILDLGHQLVDRPPCRALEATLRVAKSM